MKAPRSLRFLALGGLLSLGSAVCLLDAQRVDRDGDGVSDLWQLYYGIGSIGADQDSDGDGTLDRVEAVAGTDPLSKESNFNISHFELKGDTLFLTVEFAAIPTKVYQFQQSRDLEGRTWANVGDAIEVEVASKILEQLSLADVEPRRFIRLQVSDKDEDDDGLSAFDEFVLGTSDQNLNSSGHPKGTDFDAALDWLSENDPGANLDVDPSNLREVDVAWVQQPIGETTPALVVSMTGTGGWYQLSEWSVSANGVPVEIATTPPQDGHHIKIINLQPDVTSPSSPKQFVTGRIRDDGDLWLHSRACTEAGGFIHYDSKGFGSNADVNVHDYAMAQRPLTAGIIVTAYQVVTVVIVTSPNIPGEKLRVVTWRVDSVSGDIIGQQDSGNLTAPDLPSDPDEANVQIAHMAENQFVITYTNSGGTLSPRRIEVSNSGVTTYMGGGGSLLRTLQGSNVFSNKQQANAVAGVAANGFVTAMREPDNRLKLATLDYIQNDAGEYLAHLLGHNELDLSPDGNGVHLPAPILTDSWDYLIAAGDFLGSVIAVGDFDGDGRDDLAIGAPNRDVDGEADAGTVFVIEANASGITNKEFSDEWTQSSAGLLSLAESGDFFGFSMVVGDFNDDGIDDLAIGSPGEDVGSATQAGVVQVLFGTPFGLSTVGHLLLTQETVGLTSEQSDFFGWSLASGDFNGDNRDDLAIGILNESAGRTDGAGAVAIVWGTSSGLDPSFATVLDQNVPGTWDAAEAHDQFGRTLAVGDFNKDSFDDLVVGISREDYGGSLNAGAIQVFYGSADGLEVDIFVTQAGFEAGQDIEEVVEASDYFGESLAVGDFNQDGIDDLAVGAPNENLGDTINAGGVHILYGTNLANFGLTWANNQFLTQEMIFPGGGSLGSGDEHNDKFGTAMVAGDFNGNGIVDLVVSAPGERTGPDDIAAGAVFLIRGGLKGLVSAFSRQIYQGASITVSGGDKLFLDGEGAAGDFFGGALVAGDFNADGLSDLVVGIPNKELKSDSINSGAVHIIPGSSTETFDFANDEEWFARLKEDVRAMVSELVWESEGVESAGMLFEKNQNLEWRQAASVTKCMTLLITVKAIEDGFASLGDMVTISQLAGETGGSKLWVYDSNGDLDLDDDGEEVPFIEPGDTMPLRLLLGGMMNNSGNRCSVAIGQHIAEQVRGDPDDFVNMMNVEAANLGMDDTLFGHTAGGMATKPQDLINLLAEGVKHPLFVELGGLEIYGIASPYSEALCGTDAEDVEKCNGPFPKFNTISSYAGRAVWKGGNIGLWFGENQANDVPKRPDLPPARAASVVVVNRMDRWFGSALLQSGDRDSDAQNLFNFAIPKVFAPDHRATEVHPKPGGIQNPEATVRVKNFAIDSITHNTGVTVVIDEFENIQIDTWIFDAAARTITPAGKSARTYHLLDGATVDPPNLVDMAEIESFSSIKDFFTANLNGNNIDLQFWRVGENP